MSDEEKFPQITPYRPLWEDEEDKGWAFAVIVSCVTIIGMVVYAAALRLLFGG